MEKRNPEAVCAYCPMFWKFTEEQAARGATGGNCRHHWSNGMPHYVQFPNAEFCTDHPEWKLIERA